MKAEENARNNINEMDKSSRSASPMNQPNDNNRNHINIISENKTQEGTEIIADVMEYVDDVESPGKKCLSPAKRVMLFKNDNLKPISENPADKYIAELKEQAERLEKERQELQKIEEDKLKNEIAERIRLEKEELEKREKEKQQIIDEEKKRINE